jgi:hypothetical protein
MGVAGAYCMHRELYVGRRVNSAVGFLLGESTEM